jgi:hypothetical protein
MKTRRWRRYGLIAILLFLAAIATWLMARPRLHINRAMFSELQVGMSLEEIEHVVKVPPGDYSFGFNTANRICMAEEDGLTDISFKGQALQSLGEKGNVVVWKGSNRNLIVRFDGNGKANLIAYSDYRPPANDWIGRFVHWLNSSSDD